MKVWRTQKRKHHAASKRGGFTLIELLASLVLAGLLMMTTGQLLSILRQQETLIARTAESDSAWVSRILDLIEQDLHNSRTVRATPSGFELSGYAGTDRTTGKALQSAVLIRWAIENQLGRLWLTRTESNRTALSNRPDQRRIIATDVDQVSLWFTDAPNVRFFSEVSRNDQSSPLPASIICQLSLGTETTETHRRRTILLKP